MLIYGHQMVTLILFSATQEFYTSLMYNILLDFNAHLNYTNN